MAEYIELADAVIVADYAVDEHPYDKIPGKPETFSEYNQGWHDACDYIRNRLENLPAADVEPVRHGKWKFNDNYALWAERYICSECGRNAPSDGDYRHELTDYCPNCGARMDGG